MKSTPIQITSIQSLLSAWSKDLSRGRAVVATLAVLVASLLTAVALPVNRAEAAETVNTSSGVVRGNVEADYLEFLGIPYAEPPVGDLRWRAPEPAQRRSGINAATEYGPQCPQGGAVGEDEHESEDCLYLNIWTPKYANPGARLPVAVYIHGGAFRSGSGDGRAPASLVTREDMVVVKINYRLGALGNLTLPQIEDADGESGGNYGLLDQIQALRWIQENIAGFGGDPDRVMIAGQSAGGESVCTLLASPPAEGLFSSAVAQAGLSCIMGGRATTQRIHAEFVTELDCDYTDDSTAVAQCLRQKTPSEVLAAQGALGSVWYPTTLHPALPFSPPEAFDAGLFNRVPVLIGNNSGEGGFFQWRRRPISADDFEQSIEDTFGVEAAAEILPLYPLDVLVPDIAGAEHAGGAASAAIKTDVAFTCPMLMNAASLSRYTPTWVYIFRDETANRTPYGGPQHGAEIRYVWDPIEERLDESQLPLAKEMIAYWAELARSGSPTPSGHPMVSQYSPEAPTALAFDTDGTKIIGNLAELSHCDFWNEKYPEWTPQWPFHFGPGSDLRFD